MLTIICLVFGAVLAQRCKVLILVPAIAVVGLVAAIIAIRGDGTFWHVLGAISLDIAALQMGYLAGLGLHYVISALQLASMRRNSLNGSMSSRRTAN